MKPTDARAALGRARSAAVLALLLAATACGGSPSSPAPETAGETIRNCDVDVAAAEPPERVFAAYQPAIETAHALGISDRLVGTAFLDAEVMDEHAAAQAEQEYYPNLPSLEELLSHEPDFVLSGFNGVFTDESLGTRASLRELGVESWILSPLCPSEDGRTDETIDPATVTMDNVYADLRDLGTLFDEQERAEQVIAGMEATVEEVAQTLDGRVAEEDRPTVMIGRPSDQGFRVAGGPDFSTEIIDLAGGVNAFADLDGRRNHDVATEDVIARDPDFILVDVCCDARMTSADAADQIEQIMDDPALANLTAVTGGRVEGFTFADRSAGVRSADAVAKVAGTIHSDLFG
ncbi:lipoprotein [Nocardiopsis terrae]|uniref:Iron complex transport system substrate-binding protein n=1 Tax=Nocardiopsis terrae TaxID=372655 RepID=A0ABR9HI72_9ACTN|nr:ABC transporter substrate-binding protein [Nocardiopsis terrae]MBE1458721.1 iron complex transport system substrate-binding protein [Nocardiopsis terrae]GHC78869.1 lipoprotein [Nocardiopsis terrae]